MGKGEKMETTLSDHVQKVIHLVGDSAALTGKDRDVLYSKRSLVKDVTQALRTVEREALERFDSLEVAAVALLMNVIPHNREAKLSLIADPYVRRLAEALKAAKSGESIPADNTSHHTRCCIKGCVGGCWDRLK